VWIPKSYGRQRPLGIAALEDKIVRHAVVQVLNQIRKRTFRAFRTDSGRGAVSRGPRWFRGASDALYVGITGRKVNYVLDLGIRSFFDKVGHDHLETFIRHRIGDERLVRLILKWLRAGMMEDGKRYETEEGLRRER
jgi:retron-type reverse transcriptase